jgi:predicted Ser/Thr protein kinase
MAVIKSDYIPDNVLQTAYLAHIRSNLRAKLMETAREEVEAAVIEATSSLRTQIVQRYDHYAQNMVLMLSINGVNKDV